MDRDSPPGFVCTSDYFAIGNFKTICEQNGKKIIYNKIINDLEFIWFYDVSMCIRYTFLYQTLLLNPKTRQIPQKWKLFQDVKI